MSLTFSELLKIPGCPADLEGEIMTLQAQVEGQIGLYLDQPGVYDGTDLNESWWRTVALILRARVWMSEDETLHFSDRDLMILNFGVLDERLLPVGLAMPMLVRALADNAQARLPARYFGELLNAEHARIVNASEYYRMHHEMVQKTLARRQQLPELKRLQEQRDRAIGALDKGSQLLATVRGLDEALPFFSKMSAEISERRLPKTEQNIHEYKKLKAAFDGLKMQQTSQLRALGNPAGIQAMLESVTHRQIDIVRLELAIEDLRRRLAVLQQQGVALTPGSRLQKLMEFVTAVRETSTAFAGRILRKGLLQVLMTDRVINDRAAVAAMVDAVLEVDHPLAAKLSAGGGQPVSLVILPGAGEALYEQRARRIWAPLMFLQEKAESLVASLGQLRYDLLRAELDGYDGLDHVRELKADIQIRRQFGADYADWILRDSKGFRKLPQDAYQWFASHV